MNSKLRESFVDIIYVCAILHFLRISGHGGNTDSKHMDFANATATPTRTIHSRHIWFWWVLVLTSSLYILFFTAEHNLHINIRHLYTRQSKSTVTHTVFFSRGGWQDIARYSSWLKPLFYALVSHDPRMATFFKTFSIYWQCMHMVWSTWEEDFCHMCKQTAIKSLCMEQHNEIHYCNCGGVSPRFDTGIHKHIILSLWPQWVPVSTFILFFMRVCMYLGAFECRCV